MMDEAGFRAWVEPLGRTLEQRTTLYGRPALTPSPVALSSHQCSSSFASMSRTCSLVHDRQRRPTPRAVVSSDQPGGSPSPPASSSLLEPHRLHVATSGTVPVPG